MKLFLFTFIFLFSSLNATDDIQFRISYPQELPNNFRAFPDLQVSGSCQFSVSNLPALLNNIPNPKVVIIDLREESHGFINNLPVMWYNTHNDVNRGKSLHEIIADEQNRLTNALHSPILHSSKKDQNSIVPTTVATEEEAVIAAGARSLRLPVTDHSRPNDATVDMFIYHIKKKENSWFHLHCHAGKGRTTTFLLIYDMLHNAHEKSFESFLTKHLQAGGSDFLKSEDPSNWKYDLSMARKAFLQKFYRFCKEADLNTETWSEWSQRNP
ncbi:MAG: phytase [Parachlamydiaceae bacterium]|nr:phytase [Parachlamydiaceae bacterium]